MPAQSHNKSKSRAHNKPTDSARAQRKQAAATTMRLLENPPTDALAASIDDSRSGTTAFLPTDPLPILPTSSRRTANTVFYTNQTDTLAAVLHLEQLPSPPRSIAALNFASAKHKGGGWLNGAQAQEESITRRSTLFAALDSDGAAPYYNHNARHIRRVAKENDGVYTHALIHSPAVAILQPDEDSLAIDPDPTLVSVITCAAPNAGQALKMGAARGRVEAAFAERIDRVLAAAAAHSHDGLVLGAWGCGVFGNDPGFVAGTFKRLLAGKYKGSFSHVSFPLRDDDNKEPFLRALGT